MGRRPADQQRAGLLRERAVGLPEQARSEYHVPRHLRANLLIALHCVHLLQQTSAGDRRAVRISPACSWVNIDGTQNRHPAQVGHFCFGAVGPYYSGN